jgi:hypothetical protein
MNTRMICLLVVMAAFLAGAFVSVLDPRSVEWGWLAPILAVGAAGLFGFRRALHREARSGERVEGNMQTLSDALDKLCGSLDDLHARQLELPVYEARFEIDRLLRDDLDRFADARETMIHVLGMKQYADVMSAFAAGERYINRVWSASTDGYRDEVLGYIGRARDQLHEARDLFVQLRNEQASRKPA